MTKKDKLNGLKGKDLKEIISDVDNKYELIAAIWLCKNKEAKNVIIIILFLLVLNPDWVEFFKNWIMDFFK